MISFILISLVPLEVLAFFFFFLKFQHFSAVLKENKEGDSSCLGLGLKVKTEMAAALGHSVEVMENYRLGRLLGPCLG